jgi:methylmalonyl-CoA mutase N-terminal domain/subunit
MDEALALPSEQAVQVALRTQQLIAYETGVADTVDPLAGSYYIEKLTDEIEARAQAYIDTIEKMGGPVVAIEKGYIQKEIQESAYRYQKEIEANERIIVGLNKFQVQEEKPKELLKVDPTVRDQQVDRLRELKGQRNQYEVRDALAVVREAAQTGVNLMPPILQAVRSMATLGEICDTLREVFGEYEAAPFV